ncbi:hypothetical protein AQUCO_05400004v1 [Aquilegia coerulea]|uniref:Uncharacterized protein n=1 Tax=Aquilegia coerulea TaxID=218851 RepID=A0A2G5CH42_AQUCA|nr:hypothetical protein AQUCO_05400004v1 [Aquilegia coerulea]
MEYLFIPTLFLNPVTLEQGISATSHLVLLLLLLGYLVSKKKRLNNNNIITPTNHHNDLVTPFNLLTKTLVWVAILYFQQVYYSNDQLKLTMYLRVWWCLFFLMACSFLVIDIVFYKWNYYLFLPLHVWIPDAVSIGVGFYFCFIQMLFAIGNTKNKEENPFSLIREPLLLNSTSISMERGENSCPFSTANLFSILTFSWLNPLIALGSQKAIDLHDVPQLSSHDSVDGIFPIFRDKLIGYSYNNNTSSSGASGIGKISNLVLVKALLLSTWRNIQWTALLSFLYISASFVGPYLIDFFVQYLNGPQKFKSEGYVLVSAFILSKIVQSLSQRHSSFKLEQIRIRAQEALVATIYNKLLTLSSQSSFSEYLHDWWKVPLQIILALLILYKNLGFASLAALVTTVLVISANFPLGKLQKNLQGKLMESKDDRMKATSEILRNMKILKLQGWEMKFLSKIVALRENEEGWLRKYMYVRAVDTFIFFVSPTVVAAVTFAACIVMGIPLESGKILSAIATFGMLKEAIFDLPHLISMLAQAKVSLDRISSFLRLEDLQPDIIVKLPSTSKVAVEIDNGNFSWDLSSSNTPILKDVKFQVFRGMRVGVCGTVGSGKSSLLSCILGEMVKLSGDIKLCGTKAYVSQSPWIQSGKIEENILFGKVMDKERYERVIEACSLKRDLEMLPFGDQTIIGERGINLSGGQKQRIQIARALYQDADLYLLDDPFSALDAHTGMHLYKECLHRFLDLRTVIYTTNQVEFLPSADLILVLRDGRITQSGKYNEILTPGTDFMELVGAHKKALLSYRNSLAETGALASETVKKFDQEKGNAEEDKKQMCDNTSSIDEELLENQAQIVQDEEREKGRVGIKVYMNYITTAYKGTLVPVILLLQIVAQILQIGSDYWIARFTPVSRDVKSPVEASTIIFVYTGLALGSCIFVFGRAIAIGTVGYKTATILFKRMHMSIFRAPMSFFDATPSGRILNRASSDQSELDYDIPLAMGGLAMNAIRLIGVIVVMAHGGWQVVIIYVPVVVACISYQQYYVPAARELVRLTGVCNAPVKQHFTESIAGLTTIKSFDQESRFMDTNMKLIDSCSRPEFYSMGANEWLGFRLDVLSSLTFALTLVFLVSIPQGVIEPATAGLAVTYGLNLNTVQAFVIWLLGTLESDIIAYERILQYTSIPGEAPLVIDTHRPDPNWPSGGEVVIRNLQARYAPHLPLILRGVTCTFSGGMKIGIVGRTGSGKSTLIQTFFRIVEATAGQILIDDIDISVIGLHDLRSRLSIIPQEPTMFEGTMRSNLDPLEEYKDELIWEVGLALILHGYQLHLLKTSFINYN